MLHILHWGVVFRLIYLAPHKEYVLPTETKGVWQSNILNVYQIPLVYCVFIALLSPKYVLNDVRATFSPSCPVTVCQQMNWEKTLDKNLLQTSCFYYISWNIYSLQFSLKRCLSPCTMLKHVKLKHAQILQYKCAETERVIADIEKLNKMSMFTCVLTAGSRYTNICLITILSPFFNDAGLYLYVQCLWDGVSKYQWTLIQLLCVLQHACVCVLKAWNLSLAALLIRHRRWMNPEWTEGKPTVWRLIKDENSTELNHTEPVAQHIHLTLHKRFP